MRPIWTSSPATSPFTCTITVNIIMTIAAQTPTPTLHFLHLPWVSSSSSSSSSSSHYWSAPLSVLSITRSQQPSERAILSHIDCFSQCEIVGLQSFRTVVIHMIWVVQWAQCWFCWKPSIRYRHTANTNKMKAECSHCSQSCCMVPQWLSGTANHSQSPGPMLMLTAQKLLFSWWPTAAN